jgi:plastocyanin
MNISGFFRSARRFTMIAALTVLMSIALAACGGENPPATATNTPGSSSTNGATAQDLSVSLVEWAIEPKDIEADAGKVRFTVANNGQFPHDFAVQVGDAVSKTPVFQNSDGTKTLEVDLPAGTYRFFCSVGDHAQRGMEGEIVIK